jgi:hypothetical protein
MPEKPYTCTDETILQWNFFDTVSVPDNSYATPMEMIGYVLWAAKL